MDVLPANSTSSMRQTAVPILTSGKGDQVAVDASLLLERGSKRRFEIAASAVLDIIEPQPAIDEVQLEPVGEVLRRVFIAVSDDGKWYVGGAAHPDHLALARVGGVALPRNAVGKGRF